MLGHAFLKHIWSIAATGAGEEKRLNQNYSGDTPWYSWNSIGIV
jgi:hypothetical protein